MKPAAQSASSHHEEHHVSSCVQSTGMLGDCAVGRLQKVVLFTSLPDHVCVQWNFHS